MLGGLRSGQNQSLDQTAACVQQRIWVRGPPLISSVVMGLAALQVGAASSVVVQRAVDAGGCPAAESSVPWCAATAMPDWDSRRGLE